MPVKRLLGGFAALAVALLVTQAIGFASLVVVAKRLGPVDLGAATFALNLSVYFAIPANFGLALLGMRDLAREPERAQAVVAEIQTLRLGIAVITCVAMILLTPVIAADAESRRLLPLAALTIPIGTFTGEWILLGVERRLFVALGRLAGQALYAVLVFAALDRGLAGARQFIVYSLLGLALTSVVTVVYAARVVGRPRLSLDLGALRRRAVASAPLGVAVVMSLVYVSIGSVLLGYLDSAGAVGQFGVAQKIPLALLGIAQLWSATLYPQVAKMMAARRDELRAQVSLFSSLSAAVALPLAAGAVVMGPELIRALFGGRFAPAGRAFVPIVFALALALVSYNISSVLAAGGDERRYALGRTLAAGACLVASLVSIPLAGLDGAAASLLLAELVVLVFMVRRYRKVVGPVALQWGRVWRAAMASAVMSAALLLLAGATGVAVRLVVGIAVYALAAFALGVVRPDELRKAMPWGGVRPSEAPAAGP